MRRIQQDLENLAAAESFLREELFWEVITSFL